jgi:Dimethlysulfonioproprionate lyase
MLRTGSDGQLGALLAACSLLLAGDPAAAPFAAALATIDPERALPDAPPASLPVLRWWDDCLAETPPAALGQVARALGSLRPSLAFTQNPNYVASPPSPTFLERYGYAVLAGPPSGPAALVPHPALAFGVLLLGPETRYPTHVHPAAELYLPLGRAHWSAGGRPLVERPAGVPIVHVPNEPHATRTAGTPLAALYVWLGELETAAQILGPGLTRP